MINTDIKQRIKICGIFLLQSYKIITGTMLSLFLPQDCGDHMCSLTENYNNSVIYHKIGFYWNSISAFSFFCYYLIELRREEWCVKYLDINNDIPDNSLKHIIDFISTPTVSFTFLTILFPLIFQPTDFLIK